MKLLLVLGMVVGGYTFVLLHTTDTVLNQVQHVNATYQYVADHADQIAGDR